MWRKVPQYDGIDFAPLRTSIATYFGAAKIFGGKLLAAEWSSNSGAIEALRKRAMVARDAFWMPDGLAFNNYWRTIDLLVAPFPELSFMAYETDNTAKVKAALDSQSAAAVRKATCTIRG